MESSLPKETGLTHATPRVTSYHIVTQNTDRKSDPPDKDDPPETERAPLKERVIHTRVPAALDDALKKFALSMRVPVSNLVRVLLEDAVSVAQRATDRVAVVAEHAAEAAEEAATRASAAPDKKKTQSDRDALSGVFGFQPLTMAIDTLCARCGTALGVGDDAFLGLRDGAGPRVFVCGPCIPKPKEK